MLYFTFYSYFDQCFYLIRYYFIEDFVGRIHLFKVNKLK
jgi:hypothetical protein